MENKLNLSDEDLALIIAGRLAVDEHDTRYYYNDQGQLHRENGPAIIQESGNQVWYLDGRVHRESGPAVERIDGTEEWFFNGKLHRDGGPAVIWSDGVRSWYQHGKHNKTMRPSMGGYVESRRGDC